MNIRKTELTDIEELQKLYEHARTFMADHGNPTPVSYTHLDVYKRQVCLDKQYGKDRQH